MSDEALTSPAVPLGRPPRRPRRRWRQWLLLPSVVRTLQRLNQQGGADRQVIEQGQRYLADGRGDWRLFALLCEAYWGVGDWRRSLYYGRLSLALRPAQAQTLIFVLSDYRNLQEPAPGISRGARWLERHGVHPSVCRHLAILQDDAGQTPAALATARRGLAVKSDDLRLAAVTAHFLAKQEGAAAALRFAAPYRAAFAGDSYCDAVLADGLVAAHAYADAEERLLELHRREPRNDKYLGKLLAVWFELGRHEETLQAVARWESHTPATAALANEAGRTNLALGRDEDCLRWLRRAVELAPNEERFADNLGVALGRLNRHRECIAFCESRLKQAPRGSRYRLLTAIAVALTELGDHRSALGIYEEALEERPDEGAALANVLMGLNWLERYADAVARAAPAVAPASALLVPRFWSELAWAQHHLGAFAEEAAAIARWQQVAPDDPDLVRATCRCLRAQQRGDEATRFAREWIAGHPQNPSGWRHLADHYQALHQSEAQLDAAQRGLALAPADAALFDLQLIALRRLGRAAAALQAGTDWVAAHPGRATPSLLNRLGLAADDLEDWPLAELWYERAHRAEPAEPVWLGNLLRARILQGKAEEAAALGQAWMTEHGNADYVASKRAWALRQCGRLAEETEVLRAAFAAAPAQHAIAFDLFNSLLEQKRTDEAASLLHQLTAAGAATSGLYNNWGNHQRDRGQFAEAEAAYRHGLLLGEDNPTVVGNLASLLVARWRAAEARTLCTEWLARHPDQTYVRRQLAHALYDLNDYAAAAPEYERVLAKEPESTFMAGRRVACLRLLGQYDEALAAGRAWTARHTPDAFLLTELGIAARRSHRETEAVAYFEQALLQEPSWASAAYWKMETLGALNRLDEAIAFGERWAAATSPEADFCNELAILLDRAGQLESAERYFRRAVDLDEHDATLAGNAVEIITRRGAYREAIELGQRALGNAPPNGYLLRRLGEAYSRHDEHHAALDLLQRADELASQDEQVALSYLRIADLAGEVDAGISFARTWVERPGNDQRPLVWDWLSRLLFRADQTAAAYSALAQAQKLAPHQIRHTRLLFSFLLAEGDYLRLTELYRDLGRTWQEDPLLLQRASRAYFELGIRDEALSLADQGLRLYPNNGACAAWRATLHRRSGDDEAALRLVEAWTQTHGPHADVALLRAEVALDRGEPAAALRDAELALSHDATAEDAFVVQVRALRALGRHDRARKLLHHWIEHHRPSGAVSRLLEEIDDDRRAGP